MVAVMKFIVDDKIPFVRGVLEPFAEVQYLPGKGLSASDVRDADALIVRTRTRCNASLLEGSSVRAIFTATIGYDHIDATYCYDNNIHWQNAPGCNSRSVQQYIASVLALLHLDGKINIADSTIAIVGVGNVGSKVEDWCRKLGMNVLLVDPVRADRESSTCFVEYGDALSRADIITFHTPLIHDGKYPTFHMFDDSTLDVLKPGAVVINASRGEVCDTFALLKGLNTGVISEVVADVWENEPNNVNAELMERAYLATPHVAGYSYDSKRNGTEMTMRALSEFFSLPLTCYASGKLEIPKDREFFVGPDVDPVSAACKMFLQTYDVLGESQRYKSDPEIFEKLRGDYPLRREIGAYILGRGCAHSDFLCQFGIQCPNQ